MMAREHLYRRSFHLDKDVKGIDNLFELDRASALRQGISADARTLAAEGGFEAPRNSLDVPFNGLLEARRNSEVRCEEIPIGYELSRSLTTRRLREDNRDSRSIADIPEQVCLKPKGDVADIILLGDLKSQTRVPSVVARLMGLDDLPRQDASQGCHHSSLRRVLREDCITSYSMNQSNMSSPAAELELSTEDYIDEKFDNGELSFRNHPQEKQLQEFKKEFVALQARQGRPSEGRVKHECRPLCQKREQMDPDEFLDALNFLNANKDFFVKVLNDPNSSFAKHLQQGCSSISKTDDGEREQAGAKVTRSPFECHANSEKGVSDVWVNKRVTHQSVPSDKMKASGSLRWGRDVEMPGRSRWRTREGSPTRSGGALDHAAPTRIVVLKPNLDGQSNEMLFSPTNPLLYPDVMLKLRSDAKKCRIQDARMRKISKNNGGLARDFLGDDLKDGPYDARAIAKQIVKHVKDDMSQRAHRDGAGMLESLKRRPLTHGGNVRYVNFNRPVDGHLLHRAARDAGRLGSSLSSTAGVSKYEKETDHRQLSPSRRRGMQLEETRKKPFKQPIQTAKSFREFSKFDDEYQGLSRKEKSVREPKALKKSCRSSNSKTRDSKCEAPRVLSRSLSAPAAPYIENRALESESKEGYTIERATCSSRARASENSVLKERLVSLKDSFSLSKKRVSRKVGNTQCEAPLDGWEIPASKQPMGDPIEYHEDCNSFTQPPWQAVPAEANEDVKEVAVKPLDETTSEPPRWILSTDLVDTTSETSVDKSEQPSPVSVLDTPFQEMRQGSQDLKEKENKCQDCICGLAPIESDLQEAPEVLHGRFIALPSLRHGPVDSSEAESLDMWNFTEAHIDLMGLYSIDFTQGIEEELTYILHVLRLSGVAINGYIVADSLSSEHELDQSLFARLEAFYNDVLPKEASVVKKCGQSRLDSSCRRLLFDLVDEVVASAFEKRLSQPWMMYSNQRLLICTSKQLVELIFSHFNYCRAVLIGFEEEALEDIASRDLMSEGPWVQHQSDIESVVIDLEKQLCGDVIRELVHELRN